MAAVLKTAGAQALEGSNPSPSANCLSRACIERCKLFLPAALRIVAPRCPAACVLLIITFPAPAGEQTSKAAGADGARGGEEGKAEDESDQEAEPGTWQ